MNMWQLKSHFTCGVLFFFCFYCHNDDPYLKVTFIQKIENLQLVIQPTLFLNNNLLLLIFNADLFLRG